MHRRLGFLLVCLTLALFGARSAVAQGVPGVAQVSLIPGWRQSDGTHIAAVSVRLAPGWHTYWRVPGEAGIPPQFDWRGSRNLKSVRFEWPRPVVFETAGIPTIGYADEMVLPMILTPIRSDEPIMLDVGMFFGVCEDICIPADARLAGLLAPDALPEGRARIEAALADRPETAADAGVTRATCTLAPRPRGYDVVTEITFRERAAPAEMVAIEVADPELWVGSARSRANGNTVTAVAPIEAVGGAPVLDRSTLRVTLLDGERAVEILGCKAPG